MVSLNEAEQKNAKAFWGNAVLNCINKVKETKVLSLQILNSLDNIHKKHIDNLNINNALAWGDLSPSNLIVNDKKKLVSIIDFESYFIFDSALSLGYFSAIAPQNSLCKELMTQSKNYPSLNLTQENIDLCAILRLCRLAPHD